LVGFLVCRVSASFHFFEIDTQHNKHRLLKLFLCYGLGIPKKGQKWEIALLYKSTPLTYLRQFCSMGIGLARTI
jgi:hypothetical protein